MQRRTGFFLATAAFALLLGTSIGALAQGSKKMAATFGERYPAEQAPAPAAEPPQAKKDENVERPIRVAAAAKRPRSRVIVVQRSYLDAGTEVLPGERKFLDYAFPPTHTTMGSVTNTGGRVGWHNSPLPGPFFPTRN